MYLAVLATAGLIGFAIGYSVASPVLPLAPDDREYCAEIRRRQEREAAERMVLRLRRGGHRAT